MNINKAIELYNKAKVKYGYETEYNFDVLVKQFADIFKDDTDILNEWLKVKESK